MLLKNMIGMTIINGGKASPAMTIARALAAKKSLVTLDGRGLDLSGAEFQGAEIGSAHFEGANLAGADLNRCKARNVKWTGADLSGADLRGADLRGGAFYGCIFDGADVDDATLGGDGLAGGALSGVAVQSEPDGLWMCFPPGGGAVPLDALPVEKRFRPLARAIAKAGDDAVLAAEQAVKGAIWTRDDVAGKALADAREAVTEAEAELDRVSEPAIGIIAGMARERAMKAAAKVLEQARAALKKAEVGKESADYGITSAKEKLASAEASAKRTAATTERFNGLPREDVAA